MADLMKFFNARRTAYHTNPRMIDEVLYTTYAYEPTTSDDGRSSTKNQSQGARTGDLLGIPELREDGEDEPQERPCTPKRKKKPFFDAAGNEAEIFLFQYGTVVLWGMSEPQERRFLSTLSVPFGFKMIVTHNFTGRSSRLTSCVCGIAPFTCTLLNFHCSASRS